MPVFLRSSWTDLAAGNTGAKPGQSQKHSRRVDSLNFHDGAITLNGKPGLGYDLDLDQLKASLHPDWPDPSA